MVTLFFTDQHVVDFDTAKTTNTTLFAKFFQSMLEQGVYLPPSQFEAMFISAAIDGEVVEQILEASGKALSAIANLS